MDADHGEITAILNELVAGTLPAADRSDRLYAAVYRELHRIAVGLMRRERGDHTLQPTALVHEAYMKLVDAPDAAWQGRSHFYGIAARAMRQVLVDHARRHGAGKRGGDAERVTLATNLGAVDGADLEILALHDALEELARTDARMARVVELRVFGGLTAPEAAAVLDVSLRTVDEDWRMAKMWLARELGGGRAP